MENFLEETVSLIECFITFQGESPSCGKRVLLTRFKYCSQKCPWCDTRVRMMNNIPGLYYIKDLNEIINIHNFGLLITGGEPTYDHHFNDTKNMLNKIDFPFAIVESNGYHLEKLIKEVNKRNIKYIWSPKCFNETQASINNDKLINLYRNYSDLFKGENGIYFRIVYDESNELNWFFETIEDFRLNNRVFLSPLGDTKEKLLENSPKVISVCNKRNFNFSTRVHILHNFI